MANNVPYRKINLGKVRPNITGDEPLNVTNNNGDYTLAFDDSEIESKFDKLEEDSLDDIRKYKIDNLYFRRVNIPTKASWSISDQENTFSNDIRDSIYYLASIPKAYNTNKGVQSRYLPYGDYNDDLLQSYSINDVLEARINFRPSANSNPFNQFQIAIYNDMYYIPLSKIFTSIYDNFAIINDKYRVTISRDMTLQDFLSAINSATNEEVCPGIEENRLYSEGLETIKVKSSSVNYTTYTPSQISDVSKMLLNSYNINFEAVTHFPVYGFNYNTATGKLEVTHKVIDSYNGESTDEWNDWTIYGTEWGNNEINIGDTVLYELRTPEIYYLTPISLRISNRYNENLIANRYYLKINGYNWNSSDWECYLHIDVLNHGSPNPYINYLIDSYSNNITPVGSLLSSELYKLYSNDKDFSLFLEERYATLSLEGYFSEHFFGVSAITDILGEDPLSEMIEGNIRLSDECYEKNEEDEEVLVNGAPSIVFGLEDSEYKNLVSLENIQNSLMFTDTRLNVIDNILNIITEYNERSHDGIKDNVSELKEKLDKITLDNVPMPTFAYDITYKQDITNVDENRIEPISVHGGRGRRLYLRIYNPPYGNSNGYIGKDTETAMGHNYLKIEIYGNKGEEKVLNALNETVGTLSWLGFNISIGYNTTIQELMNWMLSKNNDDWEIEFDLIDDYYDSNGDQSSLTYIIPYYTYQMDGTAPSGYDDITINDNTYSLRDLLIAKPTNKITYNITIPNSAQYYTYIDLFKGKIHKEYQKISSYDGTIDFSTGDKQYFIFDSERDYYNNPLIGDSLIYRYNPVGSHYIDYSITQFAPILPANDINYIVISDANGEPIGGIYDDFYYSPYIRYIQFDDLYTDPDDFLDFDFYVNNGHSIGNIENSIETIKNDLKDISKDLSDNFNDHIADTNNPHRTTATDVGLGNVDNTSDEDKPISNATQSALDTKLNSSVYNQYSYPVIENGNLITFNDEGNRPLDIVVNIEPQQSGSGDPSPSNVRPITGWTSATVVALGKNNMHLVSADSWTIPAGAVSPNDTAYFGQAATIPGEQYTVSVDQNTNIATSERNTFYVMSSGIVTYEAPRINYNPNAGRRSFTFTATGPYTGVYMWTVGHSVDAVFQNVMMEIGTSASAYEPSNNRRIAISFPSSAGTVYGGTLDVVRGLLTVTDRVLTFNGTEAFYIRNGAPATRCYLDISDMPGKTMPNIDNFIRVPLCSHSVIGARDITGNTYNTTATLVISNTDRLFGITQAVPANMQNFFSEQYNNGTPVQISYPLASPIMYQLTPQQLITLAGTNNVFSNCGPVTVTHWPNNGIPMVPYNSASPTIDQFMAAYNELKAANEELRDAIIQNGGTV